MFLLTTKAYILYHKIRKSQKGNKRSHLTSPLPLASATCDPSFIGNMFQVLHNWSTRVSNPLFHLHRAQALIMLWPKVLHFLQTSDLHGWSVSISIQLSSLCLAKSQDSTVSCGVDFHTKYSKRNFLLLLSHSIRIKGAPKIASNGTQGFEIPVLIWYIVKLSQSLSHKNLLQ